MQWARSVLVWRKVRGLLGASRNEFNRWPKEFFGEAQRSMKLKSLKSLLGKWERCKGIISTFSLMLTFHLDWFNA